MKREYMMAEWAPARGPTREMFGQDLDLFAKGERKRCANVARKHLQALRKRYEDGDEQVTLVTLGVVQSVLDEIRTGAKPAG